MIVSKLSAGLFARRTPSLSLGKSAAIALTNFNKFTND